MRRILFTLLLLATRLLATAYDFKVDGIAYNKNSDGSSVTVTYTLRLSNSNYKGGSGSLVIPEKVTYNDKTYTVTSIREYAFWNCSGFTGSLTIPNSVTSIGDGAFSGCSGFTGSLIIPSSVTSIGNSAFSGCSGFTDSLTIPSSVTSIGDGTFSSCSGFTSSLIIPSSVSSIGNSAFNGCSGFTGSLTIPNSVTTIGDNAFEGCSGFTGDLTIGNSVTSIGSSTFSNCSGFTGSLNIPSSVSSIGKSAFSGCSGFTGIEYNAVNCTGPSSYNYAWFKDCKLTTLNLGDKVETIPDYLVYGQRSLSGSLNIPNSVTTIGDYAFYGCSGFTGSLNIGNSVTTIGDWVFDGCSGFTGSLTIPNSVTSIGNFAFDGCSGFTGDLTIGNSVTSIGAYTFGNCSGFTGSLTIGNSVTSIGSFAFLGSNDFILVKALNTQPAKAESYVFGGWGAILQVPTGCVDIYRNATGWNGPFYQITDKDVTVFEYNNLRYTVNEDGNTATLAGPADKNLLSELVIPNNAYYNGKNYPVTIIRAFAFDYCKSITGSLIIPNSVTSIGNYAFEYCSGFTGSLTIPNSVTEIGWSAFKDCSGFSGSLNIPNSVTSIGDDTFGGCSGFTGSLIIPSSVTSIGNSAFSGCKGFTGSLTIPNSVTSIGNSAFRNCSGFTGSLNIPNSVTTIGDYAFENCSGFTGSLTIPNSVTSIGESAFYGCSGFTGSLTIGNSVTTIGDYAFYGCRGFATVKATNSQPAKAGSHAFGGMAAILQVPAGCVDIYRNATGWNAFTQITDKDVAVFNYNDLRYIVNEDGNTATLAGPVDKNLLSELVIPNNAYYNGKSYPVTIIRAFAFDYCKNITGSLNIPNTVTSIGVFAFYGCSGFTGSLTIPNSVTSIGNFAFDGCSGFTGSLTIPNSVTSIGNYAFGGCSGFTGSLIIPNSVTTIGESAFYGCSGFTEIHSLNPQPPILGRYCFYDVNKSIPLYVPARSIDAYKAADCWKEFYNIQAIVYSLYTDTIDFFGGEDIMVAVKMKNAMNVAGFQTDVEIPECFDFAKDEDSYPELSLADRATRSHTLGTTWLSSKKLRVLSYSSTNKTYSGNDGDLFYFTVKTPWDAPIQTYTANLTNTEFSSPDGTRLDIDNSEIKFRCYYIPGDANHDKKVSISDIIAEARQILLQNPEHFHYKSANVNEDEKISVSDIALTANIILGRLNPDIKYNLPRVMGGDALCANVVESRGDGSRTIAIALDNTTDYTAFQADLGLPVGMEITDARLSDRAGRSHSVAMNRIDGNTVRMLSYASDNAVFAGNSGDLLLIDVKGHGNIEMTNALFAEPNGCEHEFDEMTISTELSGINDITVGNAPVNVYNTAGQLIRTNVNPETATQGLPAGFYLVGSKKVVVR